jgi:hypothetical protein
VSEPLNIDEIERLAKAAQATPGPDSHWWDANALRHDLGEGVGEADPEFIAALSPEVVLALCAELRQAKAERDALAAASKSLCKQPGVAMCAREWEADHQATALRFHGLADEFHGGCDSIGDVCSALVDARRELAATRKAKAENDERFMVERDEARRERDALRKRLTDAQALADLVDEKSAGMDESAKAVGRCVASAIRIAVKE